MITDALDSAVSDIFTTARELFPEFFAKLTGDEIVELRGALGRTIRQAGRSLWNMDAQSIKAAFLRNWNGIAFMILAKLKAEEKNNADRILTLTGKAVATLIITIPAILTIGNGDENPDGR